MLVRDSEFIIDSPTTMLCHVMLFYLPDTGSDHQVVTHLDGECMEQEYSVFKSISFKRPGLWMDGNQHLALLYGRGQFGK
jgi:hypothetical protein